MRAKKWLVIITFDIAILALVGMFLCFFMFKNFYEIWYDIWLAVFGGATLGFIMSLIEYYAEKRSSMERFYVEALSSANAFSNVECLIINEPIELIKNCIHEEDTNKQYRKMSENLSTKEIDDMGWKIEDKARTAMISFLCNEKGMSIEELESQQLNELYNEKIIQCREKLHKCLDSYLKILDCSLLGDLSNAIGNLDFIFSNQTIRKLAYDNIFDRLRKARSDVRNKARFFRMAKDEDGHLPICLTLIQELNCALFRVDEITKNGYRITVVFRSFFDELHNEIERFRAKIYRQSPDIRESTPFRENGVLIRNRTSEITEGEITQ